MTRPKQVFEFICPRCGFDKTRLGRGLTVQEAHEGHCGLCHEEGEEVAFNVWIEGEKLWQTRCLFGVPIIPEKQDSKAKVTFGKESGPPHSRNAEAVKKLKPFGKMVPHSKHHITIRDENNKVVCSWYPMKGKWQVSNCASFKVGTFKDLIADLENMKNGVYYT